MSRPLWTRDEIIQATGGQGLGPDFAATGLAIDTRDLEAGDLFIALAGVRDGHDFVDQAKLKGAAAALVSQPVIGPAVRVPDVLTGLEQMGVYARRRASAALRGAITGSVGKTSLTQAVATGLAMAGHGHASVKSFNNHIGVPLTLARMPADTKRAVFELGMNHAGEIEPLSCMVAPHAVCITTVGPVHIENFADGEAGVALAKAEIFAGLETGGTAILNAMRCCWPGLAPSGRRCVVLARPIRMRPSFSIFSPAGLGRWCRQSCTARQCLSRSCRRAVIGAIIVLRPY